MHRLHPLRLLRYLGLVLFVALVAWVGPVRLGRALASTSPGWLVLAWLCNFPQVGLKSWRWHRIVRWQGLQLSYRKAFVAYFGSLFVGFLTPGRVGEAAKAATLKYETNASLSFSFASVLVDRAFDMYLLVLLGILGVFRFSLLDQQLSLPAFALLLVALLLPLAFLQSRFVLWGAARLARLTLLGRYRKRLLSMAEQYARGLQALSPLRLAWCGLITAGAYLLFFTQCLFCAWGVGFDPHFGDLALLMAATNFLSFIPITVAGLGTRELCLTFFLARLLPPQPADVAIHFGLTILLVFYVGAGLIGALCWTWLPLGLRTSITPPRNEPT